MYVCISKQVRGLQPTQLKHPLYDVVQMSEVFNDCLYCMTTPAAWGPATDCSRVAVLSRIKGLAPKRTHFDQSRATIHARTFQMQFKMGFVGVFHTGHTAFCWLHCVICCPWSMNLCIGLVCYMKVFGQWKQSCKRCNEKWHIFSTYELSLQ